MASKAVLRAVPEPGNPNSFVPDRSGRRANGKLALWQQNDLMREIALGEKGPQELGREFGCSHVYVIRFGKKYAREIAAIKADISDEFVHVWSAKKVNRVLMLQKQAMDRFNLPERTAEDDRTIATLLKQISEELGQLPTRQQVVSARVTHVVEGFTTSELEGMLS